MVDWSGLFKWSMSYNDGTTKSVFTEMPEADRKWLEEALKSYTFNDTDRLQEICKTLGDKKHTPAEVIDLLEECQELCELHPRNNLNLCMSGGMTEVLAMVLGYPEMKVREQACRVFTAVNCNNSEVQGFASRAGALNLIQQYDLETDPKNK